VGIPGGLEAAIHATHHYISQNNSNSTFALLKIDMKNSAVALLSSPVLTMNSQQFLLGLSGVILNLLSYVLAQDISMLPLVQQGDPLGPLHFSLVLMQFIDFVKFHDLVDFHLWYLEDWFSIFLAATFESLYFSLPPLWSALKSVYV